MMTYLMEGYQCLFERLRVLDRQNVVAIVPTSIEDTFEQGYSPQKEKTLHFWSGILEQDIGVAYEQEDEGALFKYASLLEKVQRALDVCAAEAVKNPVRKD